MVPEPITARGELARTVAFKPPTCDQGGMIELMRTNDAVTISFVEALLRDAGIGHLVADQNMSILEGSLGVLPRRVLVDSDDAAAARRLLTDAGIAIEMRPG